jgi:hypothetical protein
MTITNEKKPRRKMPIVPNIDSQLAGYRKIEWRSLFRLKSFRPIGT